MRRWTLRAVAFLAVAGGVAWFVHAGRQQAARLMDLSSENAQLRRRIADLERAAAAPNAAPVPEAAGTNAPREARAGSNPEDVIQIQRLKLSLSDAQAAINRLETRAEQAEAQVQNLRVDNQRLAASEADLKESLSSANQAVDALQAELKSSRDRVTQVEITYQKLREKSSGDTQKIAELRALSAQLQDIHQRRETYLNNVLRRYRQITEQYRSLAGVLEAQRTDAPGVNSTDLARIQDSIAMAEEDMRQVNSLTAQAQLVQKKMAGK